MKSPWICTRWSEVFSFKALSVSRNVMLRFLGPSHSWIWFVLLQHKSQHSEGSSACFSCLELKRISLSFSVSGSERCVCEYCECVCPHRRPGGQEWFKCAWVNSTGSHSALALKPVAFEAGQALRCRWFNLALCLLPWQPAASTAAARKSHRSGNAGGILKRETLVQGWASVLNFCSYGALMQRRTCCSVSWSRVRGCRPKSVKGCWEVEKKKKRRET